MSKIEWTERTWNPLVGCTIHSAGCKGCYAMRDAWRLMHNPHPAVAEKFAGTAKMVNGHAIWTGRINFSEAALLEPVKRRTPTTWFVNSMSDLFHQSVPDEQIDRIFAVMALCPQHRFQVLTKRADRMRAYMEGAIGRIADAVMALRRLPLCIARGIGPSAIVPLPHVRPGAAWWPLPNVWLGVSVEDQRAADERRESLRATPAAIRFVSYEPALEAVDWAGWEFLDWLISGGESGANARRVEYAAYRDARDWCARAGVAFFHKQNGVFDESGAKVGKKLAGRLLDGVTHDGMPT